MNNEPTLASRDEVERFKQYIEIAKYAISISLALVSVGAVLLKLGTPSPIWKVWIFVVGICVNIALFLFAHKLVSEATRCITHKLRPSERDEGLLDINSRSYSAFLISFMIGLIYWSIFILISAI